VTAASADPAARLDRAWEIVAAALPATPLVASPALGDGLLLKLETFQPTGSFKVRGALAALSEAGTSHGVVTASTGNHALGVAYAAYRLGIPATVVVPASASPAKLATLRRFPATVMVHGDSYEQAELHARSLARNGLRYLSASSAPGVIAGQATAGIELLTQLPGTFTVACGVGGGGLAAGLGLAASRTSRMTIIGVEAAASPAMSTALRAGQVTRVEVRNTLADGLAGNLEPGSITVDLIRQHVRSLVSVTEEEIANGIRYLAREHGLIAEGAGAVPVAAVLAGKIPVSGQTVAVLTGRNIAAQTLAHVLLKA
jgi:threonine dehydratase